MLEPLRNLRREQRIGLLFVLALHGAALSGLWSYRIIPAPDTPVTLMVNLINPPPLEQARPHKHEPPRQRPAEPLPVEHLHLVAEAAVAKPDEPVAYVPPPPVIEAPPLPPQVVALTGELAVNCPDRSPPAYPLFSRRMNEQGKVVLRVELDEDGRVAEAEVKNSSGYRRLDEVALHTVKSWRCNPLLRNGIAVRAVALQPFNFILEGS
ncbi:MAG: energy transducer TonB [Nitrosomonadales bacterium]|nr:energy transducer TonB [Nitrosomonadales bacterium]